MGTFLSTLKVVFYKRLINLKFQNNDNFFTKNFFGWEFSVNPLTTAKKNFFFQISIFSITGQSAAAIACSLRSQAQFYIISSLMTHIEDGAALLQRCSNGQSAAAVIHREGNGSYSRISAAVYNSVGLRKIKKKIFINFFIFLPLFNMQKYEKKMKY